MMEKAQQIAHVWNWLPGFRAVAETQHLPTAAEQMHVSPSALSRMVRLLEEAMGRPLFERVGRSLVLNDAGEVVLEAVRDAMRGVHTALEVAEHARYLGEVRLSAPAPWVELLVLPVLQRLGATHPRLTPHLRTIPPHGLAHALNQGEIDVAIVDAYVTEGDNVCERLLVATLGVYLAVSHPLASKARITWEDICEFPQVAVAHYADQVHQLKTARIRARVDDPQTAAALCGDGEAFAVLPDLIAARLPLVRSRLDVRATLPLYMLCRKTLAVQGRAELLASALRDHAPQI